MLQSKCLSRFVENNNLLPTLQLRFCKSLGTCDALLPVSTALQSALDEGSEAHMIGLDFSTFLIV